MTTNPNNEDLYSLRADCLVRHNIVPSPFDGADLLRMLTEYFNEYTDNVRITTDPVTGEDINADTGLPQPRVINESAADAPPLILPGGASLDSPEVNQCMISPQQ
jgi:hypothetical protein